MVIAIEIDTNDSTYNELMSRLKSVYARTKVVEDLDDYVCISVCIDWLNQFKIKFEYEDVESIYLSVCENMKNDKDDKNINEKLCVNLISAVAHTDSGLVGVDDLFEEIRKSSSLEENQKSYYLGKIERCVSARNDYYLFDENLKCFSVLSRSSDGLFIKTFSLTEVR